MAMMGAELSKAFNASAATFSGAFVGAGDGSFLLFCYFLLLLLLMVFVVAVATPPLPLPSVQEFETLGLTIIGRDRNSARRTRKRRFVAHFGIEPRLVAIVWRALMQNGWILQQAGRSPQPKHLLWCLLFLRIYGVEETHAARVGCEEKTFRKWAWLYAEAVAKLDRKFIRWVARLEHHGLERCLVTVDGTDYRIPEPSPFDTRWYSHKFQGPGLRYEVAVCIRTGKIVSFNGPFECGRWPDLNIFRNKLKGMLTVGEKVVADRGYRGDDKILTPDDYINSVHKKAMSNARARHETINRRLKTWGILKQVFRNKLDKHHIAFRSVLVLEEIAIENGRPPFQVAHMGDLLLAS